MTIRVMIVDDHPIIREGLVLILGMEDDMDVVAQLGESHHVVDTVGECTPDVLILDLDMPGMTGVEVVTALREQGYMVPILVFTAFDSVDEIRHVLRAGVEGYMLKGSPRAQLCSAIRVLAQGGTWLSPAVRTTMLQPQPEPDEPDHFGLSPRETEVLAQLVEGLTNREIGQVLGVTERTVKFHVSAILRKLEVDNRTEAVALAMQASLV